MAHSEEINTNFTVRLHFVQWPIAHSQIRRNSLQWPIAYSKIRRSGP
jgi:hypothetical protein